MKMLITGGAGFIGSNLCRAALGAGHEVVVLDDFATGHRRNVADLPLRVVEGSIEDPAALADALAGVDAVVHLAALGSVPRSIANPRRTNEVNIDGTLQLLEAMRSAGVEHVIYSSSSSVYGRNPALPKDERQWVRPMSPYAVSKLAAEQYVLAYQESFAMTSVAFRFFNVYGPRQMPGHTYAAVIPKFLQAILAGDPVTVNGTGEQSRDFTYVETVCQVLLACVEGRQSVPEPVNLAFGGNTSVNELVRIMEEATGRPANVVHGEPRKGDVPHSQATGERVRELFPTVVPVPITEGIGRTLAWFRENGELLGVPSLAAR